MHVEITNVIPGWNDDDVQLCGVAGGRRSTWDHWPLACDVSIRMPSCPA